MFTKIKRKIKRNQNKNKGKLILVYIFSVCLVLLVGAGGFYTYQIFHKPAYISPLASAKTKILSPSVDMQLALLKKTLREKNIAYESIKSADNSYIITFENGSEVTISAKKDIMFQISSLQYILSRLTMEGKLFSRLDLRFDKPVIVLK